MRILFLCHRVPYPPKRGGKIRPFNMIRHLARNHQVTVATLARSRQEVAEGQGLRDYCQDLFIGTIPHVIGWSRFALHTATPFPSTFAYFYSLWLARRVKTLLSRERFQAILVHSSSMGPYVARYTGCRKIMDFGDADSEKWLEYARRAPFPLSLAFHLEGLKVRRYERWLGSCFDACSVNTPGEREVLVKFVEKPVEVITNGVDLEYFYPGRNGGIPYHPRRLVFTGNMSYPPNVDAAKHLVFDILPRIWSEMPDVELYIVGMDPTPAVRRLGDGRRVVVTGRVDDVRPHLEGPAVAVAPLRIARGLQNKVLEAMAMRVPVVASPAASEGIDAVANRDLLVADGADAFASAVLCLLRDPCMRERYAAAGRAYCERNHNWDCLLGRLEDLVLNSAAGRSTGTTPLVT